MIKTPKRFYTNEAQLHRSNDSPLIFRTPSPIGDPREMPVSLVPLTPEAAEKMRAKVRQAINWWFDGESDFNTCLERSTDDVMKLFGFPAKR